MHHAVQNNRGYDPRRHGNQNIITVNISPMFAARRFTQAAFAPIVHAVFIAAKTPRRRMSAPEIVTVPGKMIALAAARAAVMAAIAMSILPARAALVPVVAAVLPTLPLPLLLALGATITAIGIRQGGKADAC